MWSVIGKKLASLTYKSKHNEDEGVPFLCFKKLQISKLIIVYLIII